MNLTRLSLIIILFFQTSNCLGQEKNYITLAEYNNILVDGVKWENISNTNGNIFKMKELFSSSINTETSSDPNPSIGFWDKGYYFGFEDRSGSGNYYLVDFWIDNNSSNITIQGKTITIGDNIGKLGTLKTNTYNDGSKGVIFSATNSESGGFFIKFNSSTNIIDEIKYIDFD